jgi:hypothetical protein
MMCCASWPIWAVARAASNHHRLAVESVALAGFETFVPKIRTRAGAQRRTTPLFGCYFFPAKCPDAEVAKLLERSDRDGIIRLPARPPPLSRRLALGAPVTIGDGPFRGLSGIHQGMSAHDRELVLINILGRQTPVEIAAGLVLPSQ